MGGRAASLAITLFLLIALGGAGALTVRVFADQPRAPLTGPSHPAAMTGLNLSGGEFGDEAKLDAVYGKDYAYPDAGVAAPFLASGMNTVRLPVRWERIQHAPLAPLDPVEMGRVDAAIGALHGARWIVLDVHNGARYKGATLGGDAHSQAMLVNLWSQLAERYKGDPRMIFGLMNEPVGISASDWRIVAEASTAAIRATGATNLILVPGIDFTGAHSWTSSNAATMAGFRDPGHHFAFEMHQYFDGNSSGTGAGCVSADSAVARFEAATEWLERTHNQAFLGEFGGGPGPDCVEAIDQALTYLDHHSRAWIGWTAWAGGGWWGGYPLSLQPDGGQPKPQMAALLRHIAR